MMSGLAKRPKRKKQQAKTLQETQERDKETENLQVFVDETKRRLVCLGFLSPPSQWENPASSSHMRKLGILESESEREDDPIQQLQRQVASVIHKHNIPYEGSFLGQRNTRLRCRIRDPLSVEQILMNEELVLLRCIMQVTATEDYEKVSRSVVCLFEANGRVEKLFEWLLKKEIDSHTENSTLNTLFREDSLRIKVLSNYFKLVGKAYLRRVLMPVVAEARRQTRLKHVTDQTPRELADLLLTQLEEPSISCPDAIRVICALTKESTLERAPQYLVNALGNLLFLRWISPALIQPEKYDLWKEELDLAERRLLVLTAKILQSTVNSICDSEQHPQTDEWTETMCRRILFYLIQMPKRADELELMMTVKQDVRVQEEIELYNEIRVLRDFELQKMYRHVRLHIEEIEWVWKEVAQIPL